MTIRFYNIRDPHGYMSNFSRHPVVLYGKQWPTSEHFFQAQKFAGTEHEERVRLATTPKEAARIGRDRTLPLRVDWEDVKDNIMRVVVRAKFTQHIELRKQLVATGDEDLVEATTDDDYWGCGESGGGKNMLGVVLVEVRAELRNREDGHESPA